MQNAENNRDEDTLRKEEGTGPTDIKAESKGKADEKADGAEREADPAVAAANKLSELNDKYLRLYSEFDNYRKRTMRERADLIRTAGEDVFRAFLPVIDDFERAIRANESADDAEALKQGMTLIYNKLRNIAQQKGLTPFDTIGQPFDPDTMEAITHVDAQDETQKGKVIDEIEKGYRLGDKVIRFAKVVVAR
jgi:molecular chaperone GrpE